MKDFGGFEGSAQGAGQWGGLQGARHGNERSRCLAGVRIGGLVTVYSGLATRIYSTRVS